MDTTLVLRFTDKHNTTSVISVNRHDFLKQCQLLEINYFIRMFKSFDESTKNQVNMRVPYPIAMEGIIDYIIGKSFNEVHAIDLIKRIYCMDFLGMDTMDEFVKLVDSTIDIETYDLVHQFIDQKEYNNRMYIKFLAMKLPTNYDCSGFPAELLKAMLEVSRTNLIALELYYSVVIYDISNDTPVNIFSITDKDDTMAIFVAINPTKPLVAIKWGGFIYRIRNLYVYDIYSGNVITEIKTKSTIRSLFFSSDGNILYVQDESKLLAYDANSKWQIQKEYDLPGRIEDVHHLFGDELIVRDDTKSSAITIFNLSTGRTREICQNSISSARFGSNAVTIYRNNLECKTMMYCNLIDKYYVLEDIEINRSITNIVCNPKKNIFIAVHSISAKEYFVDGKYICNIPNESIKYLNKFNFSCDGKYIYSLLNQNKSYQIARCVLHRDGAITLKKTWDIGVTDVVYSIINTRYYDQELLNRIGHLIPNHGSSPQTKN